MNSFDAKKYWEGRAKAYRDTMQTDYHKSRLSMIDTLIGPNGLSGSVVDFGCGDGLYSVECASQGGTVTAIDIDPSMVAVTREMLGRLAPPGVHKVVEGGVEEILKLPSASYDTVLALNVLAYLDENSCSDFYRQAARILRIGGKLIVTHSNELFDLFTFNKYTVAFYEKHFGVNGIEQLIVNWNKPDRLPLPTRKNPLAFRYELANYGFDEEAQEFSIPHAGPPLLDAGCNPDDLVKREVATVQDTLSHDRWKLCFTCSIFGSRSVKI